MSNGGGGEISSVELRRLDGRPAIYWILIVSGLAVNWFGAFIKFHGRHSSLSRTVLLEASLLLLISVSISAVVGRRDWRYMVLSFFYVSLGVAGFVFIGAR